MKSKSQLRGKKILHLGKNMINRPAVPVFNLFACGRSSHPWALHTRHPWRVSPLRKKFSTGTAGIYSFFLRKNAEIFFWIEKYFILNVLHMFRIFYEAASVAMDGDSRALHGCTCARPRLKNYEYVQQSSKWVETICKI